MPDEVIASIGDTQTRMALLTLRSEMYRVFERTETQISLVATKVDVHVSTCAAERLHDAEWKSAQIRSDEQYRQSASRIAERLEALFAKHCEADEVFHDSIDKAFSRWQVWLIGTLLTIVLALSGALATMVLHAIK